MGVCPTNSGFKVNYCMAVLYRGLNPFLELEIFVKMEVDVILYSWGSERFLQITVQERCIITIIDVQNNSVFSVDRVNFSHNGTGVEFFGRVCDFGTCKVRGISSFKNVSVGKYTRSF